MNSKTKRRINKFIAPIVLCLFTLNGCATAQIPSYTSLPAKEYNHSTTKEDLTVSVYPLTDEREARKYFNISLLSAKILAIFIKLENHGQDASYLISKEAVKVAQNQADANTKVTSESPGGAVAIGAAAALSIVPVVALPVMFAGFKMISDATAVQHNFASKELRTKTVSPGKSAEGFIYFQLPKHLDGSEQWSVDVEAKRLGSDKTVNFNYNIGITGDN